MFDQSEEIDVQSLRVGLFTDTLDEINGVGRFLRDMGEQAALRGRTLRVHTCRRQPRLNLAYRKNFEPLLSRPFPYYPELQLNLPPLPEIVEWSERQRFDVIHVSTPSTMGLCGIMVAKVLKVPVLGTHHADYPAYANDIAGEPFITAGTIGYMKWFYARMSRVFSRSREYHSSLHDLGVHPGRLRTIVPAINTDKFNPRHADPSLWRRLGVAQPRRLLYCGRVSHEKNLSMLVEVFQRLCSVRRDVALIIAGDGPYLGQMRQELEDLPAYFLGYQNDKQLGPLYATADLFAFPSRTDTLGQVVMEAQASGLPVLVTDVGGPQEMIDDGLTGMVLPAEDPQHWCRAIDELLEDEPRRLRMARTGPQRVSRYSLARTFDSFWEEHWQAAVEWRTVARRNRPLASASNR
jgi:glycosyltransferase involved in cell wall biosynthesis